MLQFSEKLLNNLMQIGLTVSLAALVPLILRRLMKKRYPARMVCVVWAILALRLLIPVQLTLPQAPVQVMPRTSYVVQSDQTAFRQAGLPVVQNPTRWVTGTQAQTLSAADTGTVKTVDITDILLTLWLAGVIACVLWQGIGYYRLIRSLKGTSQPVERADLHTILQEQCADLVIDREIPLRVSSAADCPMLAGFIHPTLYLPDERISRTDAAFIFRHELTHYKHGDLWLKLLLLAARCLHWFNPLVHLIARFAQEDIEAACDDAVVRGHDGAYRRAYGETILRSAIAQAQKRKALVSCFGDDKKTLMRRFEGLFDKSVKKRGVALVVMIALLVGSLSCTIAVGDRSTPQTTEERALLIANTFAQAYVDEDAEGFYKYLDPSSENAEGDTFSTGAAVYKRYTTRYEPETQTALIVYEYEYDAARMAAQGMQANGITPGLPYREAQRLYFTGKGDKMLISKAIWEADSDLTSSTGDDSGLVNSLEHFKLLYENDLGLPDFVSADNKAVIGNSDPVSAAEVLLGIAPAASQVEGSNQDAAPYNDIRKVTFTFKDNSKVVVTMINQFGQGWLPQDWTDGSGVRSRTAADLAQQYARGVLHKSAQYIFPILTPDGQKDLIAQQMAMTGGEQWTWKYGPSSPSATDFVLVPTDDESSYCVVFRLSGSGVNDARSAYTVQTIRENKNSSVIGDIRELSTDGMTQSELFRTYYATGLSWPTVPQYIDSMDTQTIRGYADPAQAAMQYFGMALHGDSYLMLVKDTEVIRQATGSFGEGDSNTETAVVQLTFGDSSTPIKVQMEKTAAGYWQPVGVVEDITAKSGEQELGIGANARGALITGKLPPELAVGDTIKFTFANEPSGGVQLTNRLINSDGTMQDALTDEQTALTKTADGWTYTVPESMSKSLTSTAVEPYLHALVLEYTDARHIQHKAAALYAMQNGEATTVVHGDETLNSVAYRNDVLGYTLELPLSFRNMVGGSQYEDGSVHFNMLDEADSSSAHDICIMTLEAQPTAALKQSYGENWTENYAMPVKQLAEQDGLTYFLIYASDVQYDPSNAEQAARYKELYTAAQDITADNFTLDDLTDKDNTARRRQLLEGLGRHYAARQGQTVRVYVDEKTNSCEVFFSRTDWETGYKTYAADRVTFKDVTTAEPTSVEHLADSAQGLTAAQFDLLYGTLDLPVYADDELANLQRVLQKDQIPEQGAAFFLGLGDMYGIFDGDSVKIYGDNNEFASLTYQFTDPNTGKENGKYVKLTMHKATADSSLPALWMPYSYELFTA
ncbi:M56 family metallopeptidase [Agathobaculum butyriciproducens]|uniref:M56 family metallopeptidase n=1 Tax=Agathobaculum butyriciproducens TaxID=1628085 RepID=UPI001D07D357|nr:M56 family metallopeptidase [Agathobaculum butyriciproducens]MCQ5047540.1 M56 family metallopeptidase [Agathobaculum butyriciproducens]